jgi:hypothetical protein
MRPCSRVLAIWALAMVALVLLALFDPTDEDVVVDDDASGPALPNKRRHRRKR